MAKRLLIALVAVAVLVAAGLAVFPMFSGEPPAPARPVPSPPAPPEPPPADAAPEVPPVRILSSEGNVERLGTDGQWRPLAQSDLLDLDDVVRTGEDGSLELDFAGKVIGLDADTTLSLAQLRGIDLIRLDQGRVSANVADESEAPLRVEIAGSDVVAQTDAGEFDVLASDGDATVATRRGSVDVTAAGKSVKVASGQLSTVRKGKQPSEARPIPTSLFLKVRTASRTRDKRHKVRGKASPGAIISVNGVVVQVDDQGAFSHVVDLAEGRNKVAVVGRDVTGRVQRREATVVVDSRPPEVGGEMNWGGPGP